VLRSPDSAHWFLLSAKSKSERSRNFIGSLICVQFVQDLVERMAIAAVRLLLLDCGHGRWRAVPEGNVSHWDGPALLLEWHRPCRRGSLLVLNDGQLLHGHLPMPMQIILCFAFPPRQGPPSCWPVFYIFANRRPPKALELSNFN
jgi:hypothetical protein